MGLARTELVVDSWGHCVFCLEKIRNEDEANSGKPGEGRRTSSPSSSSVYCIQYLSRYLKLDMRKLFSSGKLVKKELLDRVNKSKLKVELCQDCASLTGNLVELCRNLERIQMEVTSYLELVHGRVVKSGRRGKRKQLFSLTDGKKTMMGKSQILEGLRAEVKEKCSREIKSAFPRVKVQIPKAWTKDKSANKAAIEIEMGEAALHPSCPDPSIHNSYPEVLPNPPEIDINDSTQMESDNSSPMVDPLLDTDIREADNDGDKDAVKVIQILGHGSRQDATSVNLPIPIAKEKPKPPIKPLELTVGGRQLVVGCQWDMWSIDPSTRNYKCNLCAMQFAKYSWLQRHHRYQHTEIKFRCPDCHLEFPSEWTRNNHRGKVHKNRNKPKPPRHFCEDCGEGFKTSGTLRTHQVTSHAEKYRCRCPTCGNAFIHEFYLKIHQRRTGCGMAEEAAQFSCYCDICGNGFLTVGCLEIHMDIKHQGLPVLASSSKPRLIR